MKKILLAITMSALLTSCATTSTTVTTATPYIKSGTTISLSVGYGAIKNKTQFVAIVKDVRLALSTATTGTLPSAEEFKVILSKSKYSNDPSFPAVIGILNAVYVQYVPKLNSTTQASEVITLLIGGIDDFLISVK